MGPLEYVSIPELPELVKHNLTFQDTFTPLRISAKFLPDTPGAGLVVAPVRGSGGRQAARPAVRHLPAGGQLRAVAVEPGEKCQS